MLDVLFKRISGAGAPEQDEDERRRSHRLYTDLSIEYRVILQDLPGHLTSRARIKNISQGGAYLECDTHPRLIMGQVGHFFFKSLTGPDEPGSIYLAAKGVVRRIERSDEGSVPYGLAVQFLSGPLISYHD